MSRKVPLDRALDDTNRHYLRQLGAYGSEIEKRIDASFPPEPEALAAFELAERKALAVMNGQGLNDADQSAMMDENARLRAELEALRAAAAANAPDPTVVGAPDYSGWSKAQLEAEVDRVNAEDPEAKLAKGKVSDMAAALTAYFAE